MTTLLNDVRYGLRQLRKTPGFAITAILTLALGIGATSAMFSVLDAVLLHPLPYNGADRIISVNMHPTDSFLHDESVSWPAYKDMRRLNRSFNAFASVLTEGGMTLTQGSRAVYLPATQGSDNFFNVFNVAPLLGRTFLPGEDQTGRNDVVVLSYEVWQQDFGGRRSIVGKAVDLDGRPYTVIGVMPAGFRYPIGTPDLIYTPLHVAPSLLQARGQHWLQTLGRLSPGVTLAQARADMAHVMEEIGRQHPTHDRGIMAQLVPLADAIHINRNGSNDRSELWILLAAVFAVLLIACTNVAGLLLARGMLREREMAVRAALGAGRKRLLSRVLAESVLLGIGGGVCGIAIAGFLLAITKQFLEKAFARGGNVQLNLPVLAATFVMSLLASVAAGLIPAWRTARVDPNNALKSGGNAGTARHQHRLRAGFVVVQVALSLILLICSGLLLLGLRGMLERHLGFNPRNLLTLEVDVPIGTYAGRNFVQALVEPLENRVRSIPGVTAVGSNDLLPIRQYDTNSDLRMVGQPPDTPNHDRFSEIRFLTPGYFQAMQLPILHGRDFNGQDAAKTQPVAIVNEAWVKEFLPKGDPMAHAFAMSNNAKDNAAIVGVVADGRQDLFQPALAEIDFPMTQMPDDYRVFVDSYTLFVRTSVVPTSIVSQLRMALHEVAPNVAFRTPETMEAVLSAALVTNRMLTWLFGLFAAVAVLLTAIGIYGLLSQEVASRTRDIGVRMALGATRGEVAQLVLKRVGLLLAIGVGAGLFGVLLIRHALTEVLLIQFHRDSWVIAAIAAVLAAIGLLAALLPARRAASVDPMQALRSE